MSIDDEGEVAEPTETPEENTEVTATPESET